MKTFDHPVESEHTAARGTVCDAIDLNYTVTEDPNYIIIVDVI